MFPLNQRKVGGYSFNQKTFYGTKHTGTDYAAKYVNYYAPFGGTAIKGSGPEGGTYWTLTRPNGDKLTARHLSKVLKTGQVKEGDLVAVTGNTGKYTTNPHLHQEVSVSGKLVDPETYQWKIMPTYPITIKVKLVINQPQWQTILSKTTAIQDWHAQHSQNKLRLEFFVIYTDFKDIPFKALPDSSYLIDEPWFDANVLDSLCDTTILVIRDEDLPDYNANGKQLARTLGSFGKRPTKTWIGCSENDGLFDEGVKHELMHSLFMFAGYTEGNETFGLDWTHKYFLELKQPEGAFTQLDYEHIYLTINQSIPMAQIKTQAKGASRRIILEAADENEWKVLCKIYGKNPAKPEETV
jgi:hypothetical protein